MVGYCLHWVASRQRVSAMSSKLHCNDCGRTVKDHPQSKMNHVLKYHPEKPLLYIATRMFTPFFLEKIGERIGDSFKRVIHG
jgi:hypothetical protein